MSPDQTSSMGLGLGRRDIMPEVRFWLRIMKEHSLFIQLGLPYTRPDLITEAKRFYDLFQRLQDQAESRAGLDPALADEIRRSVEALIEFKRSLIRLMVECQMYSSLYPLLLAHVTREAIHFLEFLQSFIVVKDGLVGILDEQSFWLRQMKEHIEFVIALLDPTERELLAAAQSMRVVFSGLLETARDLGNMAEAQPGTFNAAVQFTENVTKRVTELRDFKAAAFELATLCRLLSAVSTPLLLDHLRREADKFLDELKDMREMLRRWECVPRR